MRIYDNVRAYSDKIKQVILRTVLFGARKGDEFEARLNGVALPLVICDYQWKDHHIFSPASQPPSGGADSYRVNPEQKLLRLDFNVLPHQCHFGENQISVRIVDRAPYECNADIAIEKLEVRVGSL